MKVTPNNLILDSNLLLLLTAGTFEPRTLNSFKRLASFTAKDLRHLQEFTIGRRLLVTPHLLTKVSNLANSLPERFRQAFLQYLARVIPTCHEQYTPSAALAEDRAFSLFGLTDTALCALAGQGIVMTEDGRLRDYIQRRGLRVMSLVDLSPATGLAR